LICPIWRVGTSINLRHGYALFDERASVGESRYIVNCGRRSPTRAQAGTGIEAEIARRERAGLAFRLGRTNNEPGEQHARDRSCCTLYCNDGFAAYRRRRKASLPGSRGRDGGRQQKLVRVLSQARGRELQLHELQSML